MYAIVDKERWYDKAFKDLYLWKMGVNGSGRLYDTPEAAAQALADYITAVPSLGTEVTVATNEFLIVQYGGPETELSLDHDKLSGNVPRGDMSTLAADAATLIQTAGIVPQQTEWDLAGVAEGYATLQKSTYNTAKLNSSLSPLVVWITGKSESRCRVYDTVDKAVDALDDYLEEDWDGEVEGKGLSRTDFVIVTIQNPQNRLQPLVKPDQVMLAKIISESKEFTADDSLF